MRNKDVNNIFLTSQISCVAHDIPRFLEKSPSDLNLAFITTAREVEKGDLKWSDEDRESLVKAGFNVFDFTITEKNLVEIKNTLDKADVLHFCGGNQFYLLKKIQECNCFDLIREYVIKGKIYFGSSAGAIIAGPDIYPTRLIDEAGQVGILKSYKGLGLVDFIVLPHWGDDFFRKVFFPERLKNVYDTNNKFILLRDNQYIRVKADWFQIESVDA